MRLARGFGLKQPNRQAIQGGEIIGGVELGAVGAVGSIYENMSLLWGDDFNSSPTQFSWANQSGRYGSNSFGVGQRRGNTSQSRHFNIDPDFRGNRSQSPTALGYSQFSVASSVLTQTVSPTPAELLPYLPTDYTGGIGDGDNKPLLISGTLDTSVSFLLNGGGDWVLVCKMKLPAGVARGWWGAFWTSTAMTWPDYGEVDISERKKVIASGANQTNAAFHVSDSDGGADVSNAIVTDRSVTSTRFVTFACKKTGTTLEFYDDNAVEGTLASTGSYTNARVGRLRGAHRVILSTAVSTSWDGSTFTIGDWPKSVEIDWWQCWVPASVYTPYRATRFLPAINTTPGGSWAATLDPAATMHGFTPDIEWCRGVFDNHDTPGFPTMAAGSGQTTSLPGGMSVNLGTRAVTGTVPTTEGGRTGIAVIGSRNAGGQASLVIQPYNVAPAVQSLFASSDVEYSSTGTLTADYTAFHSGSLGPHTYDASSDKAWAVVTMGAGDQSFEVDYIAPASDDVATISITCTNSIGQATVVNRTITAVAAEGFDLVDEFGADLKAWWDASDNANVASDTGGTTPAVVDTDAIAFVGDKSGLGNHLTQGTAGNRPTYITDGLNSKKVAKFTSADSERLTCTSPHTDTTTAINGNDNPIVFIAAFRRGTVGISHRLMGAYNTGATGHRRMAFLNSTNLMGFEGWDGTSSAGALATSGTMTDQWYVGAWVFKGTVVDFYLDGVLVGSNIAHNLATVTTNALIAGANYNGSAFGSHFNGALGEWAIVNRNSYDANVANTVAAWMTKWLP